MAFDPFGTQASQSNGGGNANAANEFLLGSTTKAASFDHVGTVVSGVITEPPELRQQTDMKDGSPKFWPDGKPMLQLYVLIQTEDRDPAVEGDDGIRALYIKANMQKAVADAVRTAKATGLDVGGQLAIKFMSEGVPTQKGWNPPKNYAAAYKPPAKSADTFLAETPAQPVAQQPAQQVAQPTANDLPQF